MKKLPSFVTIRCMRLMGVVEGRGRQEETRDGTVTIPSLSRAALGAHSSQMLMFISGSLRPTGLYYSCFTREENGSKEGMGFINVLGQIM